MEQQQLAPIVQRLQREWPGVDVAAVVAAAYRRLAEDARITMYLPVLAEHMARTCLNEHRRSTTSDPAR